MTREHLTANLKPGPATFHDFAVLVFGCVGGGNAHSQLRSLSAGARKSLSPFVIHDCDCDCRGCSSDFSHESAYFVPECIHDTLECRIASLALGPALHLSPLLLPPSSHPIGATDYAIRRHKAELEVLIITVLATAPPLNVACPSSEPTKLYA